jgi:hypothetical protein
VRPIVHIALHLIVPALLARRLAPEHPVRAWLIMVATMAVDLDHLWADPIYDPDRCSLGFHFMHTWPMMPASILLAVWPLTRLVGVGLLIHMGLDGIDCLWMSAG